MVNKQVLLAIIVCVALGLRSHVKHHLTSDTGLEGLYYGVYFDSDWADWYWFVKAGGCGDYDCGKEAIYEKEFFCE